MENILFTMAGACIGFVTATLIIKRDTIWMQERINKLEAAND